MTMKDSIIEARSKLKRKNEPYRIREGKYKPAINGIPESM